MATQTKTKTYTLSVNERLLLCKALTSKAELDEEIALCTSDAKTRARFEAQANDAARLAEMIERAGSIEISA